MPQQPLTKQQAQEAVSLVEQCLSEGFRPANKIGEGPTAIAEAARRSDTGAEATFRSRLRAAKNNFGLTPDLSLYQAPEAESVISREEDLTAQVRKLTGELERVRRDEITAKAVRRSIFNLSDSTPKPPKWLVRKPSKAKTLGIPTLFLSDWHWGEVVNPPEINFTNEFDMTIARRRARRVVETTIHLLKHHLASPSYDGIVVALGGDMVTGDIHEELTATNDMPIMPTVIDLFEVLAWALTKLADEFGRVFVPCVTGNHGRNTRKPRAKQRTATNFDWLTYTMLERHFKAAGDDRVTFMIPEGPDAHFRIYGHRYLLTHGDQFRGGDGMIGPLGPITRGRHKKSSRDSSINREWDTMILGHFHTLMQLVHQIVNGSLKGYDEYAYANNFSFEPPMQALWLTHPEHGITFQMPVHCDDPAIGQKDKDPWVSVPKTNA